MTDAPRVSVVIPTRNGMETLPAVFDMLARQRVDFSFEIVAVDSGSTDGTLELLRSRANRLLTILPDQFDHGLTRNMGLEQARGDLIVLLVQDALPASDDWLRALTAPFASDARLAGTFARQRPRGDASAVTRYYLSRAIAAGDAARTVEVASREAFDALAPMEQLAFCTFDNVCACLRRSVWDTHRFKATPIGEDIEWAREVLFAGCRLMFVPEAVVIHSHDRSARYEFERTRVLHHRLYELFHLRTIPTVTALGRAIASSVAVHVRVTREDTAAGASAGGLGRALALAVAWPLGQHLGARSAALGRPASRSKIV